MDLPAPGQLSLFMPKTRTKKISIHPSESQIEMAICHLLRIKRFHCPSGDNPPPVNIKGMYWKNPSAGYFDSKRKAFRKHVSPYVGQGVADIILVYKGIFYGLEIKKHNAVQSANQEDFEKSLTMSGGKYFILRSIEDAERAIQEITQEI